MFTNFSLTADKVPALRALLGAVVALVLCATMGVAHAGKNSNGGTKPYTYYAVGNPASVVTASQTRPLPSFVLMGGGPDVDEAFRWMITRAGITPVTGGRLVVIRSAGDGAYNPYIYYSGRKSLVSPTVVDGWVGGAALGLSSVETLVLPTPAAANDPDVQAIVGRANALWIAGGDQTQYIKNWKGTALEQTLKILMSKNVPIGGTSAGLAVLGGYDFSGFNGTVTSAQALTDPYNTYMTFEPDPAAASTAGFISPPAFANMIFDSHLDSRDRMGRLVAFVSRLISKTGTFGCTGVLTNSTARGIGIGVEAALLVEGQPNIAQNGLDYVGQRVTNVSTTSQSAVYFVRETLDPTQCAAGKTLEVPTSSIEIQKLGESSTRFNLSTWAGSNGSLPSWLAYTTGGALYNFGY